MTNECTAGDQVGGAWQGCGRRTIPGSNRCSRHFDPEPLLKEVTDLRAERQELYERLKRLSESKEGRKPQVALGWIRDLVKELAPK